MGRRWPSVSSPVADGYRLHVERVGRAHPEMATTLGAKRNKPCRSFRLAKTAA